MNIGAIGHAASIRPVAPSNPIERPQQSEARETGPENDHDADDLSSSAPQGRGSAQAAGRALSVDLLV